MNPRLRLRSPLALRSSFALLLSTLALALGVGQAQGIPLEHAAGTTELAEPATRVVALEWTYVEDLLALGVQPVGVADVAGYEKWVNVEPELDASVADVGTRQEPSLEAILALEPDLIIGVQFRHEAILDQLEAIAPTLLFNPYPAEGGMTQLQEMESTFRTIALAVDRAAEAEAVLERVAASYDEAREALEAAGKVGQEVLLVQAYTYQNSPQIRVFTDNAMAVGVLEAIGLRNAWPGEYATYGFDTIEVEGLAPVAEADAFFYVTQQDDDVFADTLADNPLWRSLPFVQQGHAYPLGGDTWLFGGPLSTQLIAAKIADLLTD